MFSLAKVLREVQEQRARLVKAPARVLSREVRKCGLTLKEWKAGIREVRYGR